MNVHQKQDPKIKLCTKVTQLFSLINMLSTGIGTILALKSQTHFVHTIKPTNRQLFDEVASQHGRDAAIPPFFLVAT